MDQFVRFLDLPLCPSHHVNLHAPFVQGCLDLVKHQISYYY